MVALPAYKLQKGYLLRMPVHDISVPLSADLPHWPGEKALARSLLSDLKKGDTATVSLLELGAHTGTHIDAPKHFIDGGGGIDTLSLEATTGPCVVADLTGVDGAISGADLQMLPPGVERLIAKTRNSGWSKTDTEFRSAFDAPAARWCVEKGLRLVGIDYLSIEPFSGAELGHPTHRTLLDEGIVVLEGLDLDGIDPGTYFLVALPLLIPDADGAPARVVLFDTWPPHTW